MDERRAHLGIFSKGRGWEGGLWGNRGCQCTGVMPLMVIYAVFSILCVFETAINKMFIHLNVNITERPWDLQKKMKTLGQEVLSVLHAPHDPCSNSKSNSVSLETTSYKDAASCVRTKRIVYLFFIIIFSLTGSSVSTNDNVQVFFTCAEGPRKRRQ